MSSSHIDTLAAPAIPPPSTDASKRFLPWLVAVAFFMESLDTTILNTAVPTMASALHVAPLAMKSVLASYTLSLAVFIPISGWMADRFGSRRVFASAIALFTLGSLLCGLSSDIRLLVACRIVQGCGGAMMVPVGRLTLVRTFAKSELIQAMSFVAIPGLIGPMLGPIAGGLIVAYLHWRVIFFVNIPIGLLGLLMVHWHMPDYREAHPPPLDVVGLVLFGSGIGLLSYVLEVFGEHTLSPIEVTSLLVVSLALIGAYWIHAQSKKFPLLHLTLFRIRTFAGSVSGSFFTRIGIGGVPFLLPLLYQIGLGFTPVQSGLLIMPQAAAAIVIKFGMQQILAKIGYRAVLVSNTIIVGILLFLFGTIGQSTHVWEIVLLAYCYGTFTSLQYTSMNTLVFADINDEQTSAASTIASTMQQMSMSFGVASAGLATTFFISAGAANNPLAMIHGIHKSLYALGGFTVLSTVIFRRLKKGDGYNVSHRESDGKMLAAHGSA